MRIDRPGAGAVLVAWLALVVGCGETKPSRAPVEGLVTLEGVNLQQGSIVFVPAGETRGPKAGGPIENGRFELDAEKGPCVGRSRVEIHSEVKLLYELDNPQQFAAQSSPAPPTNRVPARYNANSELFVDVIPDGPNEYRFDLSIDAP